MAKFAKIPGMGGLNLRFGIATLASGEAEVVTGMKKCIVLAMAIGANETIHADEAAAVTGDWIVVPSDGKLTLKSSNGSSTAKVAYLIIGT